MCKLLDHLVISHPHQKILIMCTFFFILHIFTYMILVTGSTGLVGRHLVLALVQSGQAIRALYRSPDKKEEVEDYFAFAKAQHLLPNITWAQGNLNDLPRLSEVFNGVTHVYHCAALISFNPYDFKRLTKINIEGTANIVNLCLSNGVEKLIHLSSIATLSNGPHNPITEENYWDPDARNSVYGLTKYGAEMEVWRATQEGLNALIFNPGIILGECNYKTTSGSIFKHVIEEKSFYPKGSAAIIDVKDLVVLLIQGMNSELSGERYIAVGHNTTYKELFLKIGQVLDKKPPHRSIKNWWKPILLLFDWTQGLFSKKRFITKAGFASLQKKKIYSAQKIKETFSYQATPLTNTLQRVARHIKESLS